MQITTTRIRFAVDSVLGRQKAAVVDKLTGLSLRQWQAEDVQFEIGLFNNGSIVTDIANVTKLTLEVKAPENLLGLALMTKDVLVAAMTANPTQVLWDAGSAQHAVFSFTYVETNIALEGAAERPLVLFIWMTDTGAKRFPLCQVPLTLMDSGFGDIGAIAIQPPGAQMVGNRLQIINPDDGTYTSWVTKSVGGVLTLAPE